MKKFKFGLLALVFTVGIGGAVVQQIHAAPKNLATFNWTHYDRSGNPIGSLNNATVAQAESAFGCSGNSVKCADAPGTSTVIKYN